MRALIRGVKNQPCKDCGKRYPYYVMDFDHVEGVKSFNLGTVLARQCGASKVIEEIVKCDIVCSNCHRERTYGVAKRPVSQSA